jgi:hypothetical protein
MIFSNDRTRDNAVLKAISEEQTAAWARFHVIEVDSRPGEREYDQALAAAKRLDAAVVKIAAAGRGRPDGGDWPF